MKAWVQTDDTGHIVCSVVKKKYATEDMTEIEVEDGFDWSLQSDYTLNDDGTLAYDGAWSAQIEKDKQSLKKAEKAAKQREKAASRLMQALGESLDDEEVYDYDCIVPEWTNGVKRKKGELVAYDGIVYRVIGNVNKNSTDKPGEDGGKYYQAVPKPEEQEEI